MAKVLNWGTSPVADVKFDVALKENGSIAQVGDTAAGTKAMTMKGISNAATFAGANAVYSAFYTGLAGGRYDQKTGVKTVKVGVVETEEE